jgi:hypothetical protein
MNEVLVYKVEDLIRYAEYFTDDLEGTETYITHKPKNTSWRQENANIIDDKFKITWLLDKNKSDNELILSEIQKILNKISTSNFDELITELKKITITTKEQITKFSEMLFEKAVLETTYTKMYSMMVKEFIPYYVIEDDEKHYFRKELVELCKTTLQKYLNVKETLPVESESDHLHRLNGCIGFTGELYNIGLIPHAIIKKILEMLETKFNSRHAYTVEAYTKLFETVGESMSKEHKESVRKCYDTLIMMKTTTYITKKEKFVIMDTCDKCKKGKWIE